MKFFVPDWDDRVDPAYDFLTDRPTLVRDPYRDDLYAHELMSEQTYDGLLISRMALGEAGPKRDLVYRIGIRDYLRLPKDLELIADCGAFGYIREKDPPYTTAEMIHFYDRLGFDYGVSIDHLIVTEFFHERTYRYELTLRNAEDFIKLHRQGQHTFQPIGAVQGWDPPSYVDAALAEVAMGYDYLGLGGLARSNTQTIRTAVEAVSAAVPGHVRLHVFGVARLALLDDFLRLDIYSVDSAAPLRQAWLSAEDNYYWYDRTYAAIRIPNIEEERAKRPRSKKLKAMQTQVATQQLSLDGFAHTLAGRSDISYAKLKRAEQAALDAMRAYDRREVSRRSAMKAIMAFDAMLGERAYATNSAERRALYEQTLADRPWGRCTCSVCRAIGVDVIIFRGNNRNRRRGFHNLYIVRRRLELATARVRPSTAAHHPDTERASAARQCFSRARLYPASYRDRG